DAGLAFVGEGAQEVELGFAFVGGDEVNDVGRDFRAVIERGQPQAAEHDEDDKDEAGEELAAAVGHGRLAKIAGEVVGGKCGSGRGGGDGDLDELAGRLGHHNGGDAVGVTGDGEGAEG